MITIEKIKLYGKNFIGDIEGWARIATKEEKSAINNKDWFLIGCFV